MRFAFVEEHRHELPVIRLCQIMDVSPRGYRAPAGTAMVFSSSLLHEVLETTKGVRYNLISHLFNEQSIAR